MKSEKRQRRTYSSRRDRLDDERWKKKRKGVQSAKEKKTYLKKKEKK